MISSFQGEYRFLSNFFPCSIYMWDLKFPSVEHAYQAGKCADPVQRGNFVYGTWWKNADALGAEAKARGRKVKLRSDWHEVKDGIMYDCLVQKFSDPWLKSLLLATGDQLLIRGNTCHDNYWGSCTHCGPGQNRLGKMLMEIRSNLQER